MNRADLTKRIAALARRYEPDPDPIQVAINVICVVEEGDPRLGTWLELDDNQAPFVRSTDFYCRDLAHFNAMVAEYHAAEDSKQEGAP